MYNIMLDLETMGIANNAAIIAIGAAVFYPDEGEISSGTFYRQINLASAVAEGGVINPSTVMWWMQQGDEARAAFANNGEADTMRGALSDFSAWLDIHTVDRNDRLMWGNGAASDNVWLRAAYENAGMEVPWMFWGDRCYRTLKALHPDVPFERSGTHHNALDDAVTQAKHLMAILQNAKQ